jgi:hypothetical protein
VRSVGMGGSSSIFEFLMGLKEGCPTLMRFPVVKRQTSPLSGILSTFFG